MEEPADEVRDALAALPTRLPRSDRRPDQVEDVLIDRLVRAQRRRRSRCILDRQHARADRREGGRVGRGNQVSRGATNMYHYVQDATTRKVARAIQAMGEGGMMRREKDEHGQVVLQHCMREQWKGGRRAPRTATRGYHRRSRR